MGWPLLARFGADMGWGAEGQPFIFISESVLTGETSGERVDLL